MHVHKGPAAYEPSQISPPSAPRECPVHGFRTLPEADTGDKIRKRSETFVDHYSQARLFYTSMTPPEQKHIASALAFELSKVEVVEIRNRMLGHLGHIARRLPAPFFPDRNLRGEVLYARSNGHQEAAPRVT
jgi:catalase